MKILKSVLLLFLSCLIANAQQNVKISGCVTDFNGKPLDSVTVFVKNKKFENLYKAITGKDGKYSIKVRKGNYYCLYAIKLSDYKKTKLEYWCWNVPAVKNLEINPQYNNMEVYGIHAFEPPVTPQETYRIYFRPMSLKKGNNLSIKMGDTINMAPESIIKEELNIKINDEEAKIVSINKVVEYARSNFMYAYEVQILKPKSQSMRAISGYDKISIILDSKETGEIGKGEGFVKLFE